MSKWDPEKVNKLNPNPKVKTNSNPYFSPYQNLIRATIHVLIKLKSELKGLKNRV